ncbi:fatty acid synthase subunit beta dehydratase [Exophiala viscosa]|uniref:Fatty acid synthase subunit beta dehydratase n=1 Tax=Exophiala viscosa TaxID=2486360 RepID=A0AAN6IDT5_9EURO|nr:fatty acid synthase subunit beta dehydratase [Exophiala viscosa]
MGSTEPTDSSSHFSVISTPPYSLRLLEISRGNFEYQFSVASSSHFYAARSRDRFLGSLNLDDEPEPSSLLEIISRFLIFIIQHQELWVEAPSTAHADCVALILSKLESDFLRGVDVHVVASRLPGGSSQRQFVVKAYFEATAFVRNLKSPALQQDSALFSQNSETAAVTVYAIFGGQGNTSDYFSELCSLYSTYTAIVEPLVAAASVTLHSLLAQSSVTQLRLFSQGLDVLLWLQRPEATPVPEYLLSAPVSFPLIGLVQLANYAVICRVLGKLPGQLIERLSGMAGHSQGVVVAAALATATTWESFDNALTNALTLLFHIGSAAQEATTHVAVPSSLSSESVNNGEGFPTPMLNVSGSRRSQLQKYIDEVNSYLEPHQQVAIGVINGPTNFVISGPVLSLCALAAHLRKVKAPPGLEQAKIAYSSRKPEFSIRFLPITAPFHSLHLGDAVTIATKELRNVAIKPSDLHTPVYHSETGDDLRKSGLENIVPALIRMILIEQDDWPLSTKCPSASHVLDFGPGGTSGVGALLHRNKEGTGVRVILASTLEGISSELGFRSEIFQNDAESIIWGENWAQAYAPRLTKSHKGELQIDNAMTRLLGVPPLMVAGMTPTTVSWEFVSAIIKSGYHVELAGGGYYNAEQLTTAIKHLQQSIPSGKGICINAIYASPKQVKWQIPLIRKLRSEGVPIDGLTFGAGVPSVDVAKEYIESLNLRYMCFKPGSSYAIGQVIAIASSNPSHPILLQWTGGRGGGHHSYEDFHDPILRFYGRIRRCPNIVLLAGSGFGGAEDTYPYLSGSWSVDLGYAAMPFDGCLFGSRMMVAKEAKTSRGAKEAIVAAPGVSDPISWEQSYNKPIGGIITVKSEMGEPIHKLATRGILLWREMDDKIFAIQDKAKRLEELQRLKPYIVKRLNDDFQKVWFGRDGQGNVVDLADMTYAEVLRRLIELLYVSSQSRWIDSSYIKLTADFVRRMFSRLQDFMPRFEKDFGLRNPSDAVPKILQSCPKADKQVVTFNDARYFILLCKRPGQKPPTFVPDLDDDFEYWFKKDSLWQSEDLTAVVGQDAQRTCILQGPVAARYSTIPDEPVGDILSKISKAHINQILKDRYHDNADEVSRISSHLSRTTTKARHLPHCLISRTADKTHYRIPSNVLDDQLPNLDDWLELLAGPSGTWLHALLTSKDVFQGRKVITNPMQRVLSPVHGMHVEVSDASDPEDIVVAVVEGESEPTTSGSSRSRYSLVIRKDGEILVTFYTDETAEKVNLPLTFKFTHRPDFVLHPIHEVMEGRNDRLRKFYYRLWFGSDRPPVASPAMIRRPTRSWDLALQAVTGKPRQKQPLSLQTKMLPRLHPEPETPVGLQAEALNTSSPTSLVFKGRDIELSRPSIQDFADSIEQSSNIISARSDKNMASLDFAIVVGWEAMMKAIFPQAINGEFLNLVHLSNKFTLLNDSAPLSSSDHITSTAEILAIRNEPAGRVVEVAAIIERDEAQVLELVSEFLFRGTYTDFIVCFEKKTETKMYVELDTPAKVSVLKSKSWINFTPADGDIDLLGMKLIFEPASLYRFDSAKTYRSVRTFGQVFHQPRVTKELRAIATIEYEAGKCSNNPVMEYLQRNGSPYEVVHSLENPQQLGEQDWLRVTVPASNQAYARASGDFNPIHLSRPFAKYANLPGTITHGMYTSAAVRQLVEKAAGLSEEVRMRSYKASFVSMVLPGDTLEVSANHVAMKDGLRVLSFQAVNINTGEKVLIGEAEVDQPLTAYVFTGQGSQKPDMGMDLYATSEIAREVWDTADRFFAENYGFLISEIVKHNPKELTVHFGGRRGVKIRQTYIDMTVETNKVVEKFFKTIDETTTSYTFRHKQGLLFSTEFAQPALTIMERAQFLHLQSKGLTSDRALFAGHSLGEYTALSTIGDIMPFDKLLAIVFYRGLTMQSAVARDESGRSRFSMVAVNPSRVSRALSTSVLQSIVQAIAAATGDLLEVVNYNVDGQQYVCAGTLTSLDCLTAVTNHIAGKPKDFALGSQAPREQIDALVKTCAAASTKKPFPIELKRGVATIPLEGIDVPFHSSFLLAKMPAFRKMLLRSISVDAIDPQRLVGKYVSNVVGKPFDISYEAVREVYETTNSFVLRDLLEDMEGYA